MTRAEFVLLMRFSDEGPGFGWSLKGIKHDLGWGRRFARQVCRGLAKKGLATFHRGGLFNDDGKLAGSGYGISPEGCRLMRSLQARQRKER